MQVNESLIHFISTELVADREPIGIDSQTELLQSGIVDSMGIMRLVKFISDELNREVAPEDITIDNFSTVSSIASYLETR